MSFPKVQDAAVDDEYGKLVGLHQFYLEIGTSAAAGSFAIVGAILTYISQASMTTAAIRITLSLPLALSVANTVVFLGATRYALDFKAQVEGAQSRLGVTWRPHVELVVGMTVVAGVLFGITAIGLALLLVVPDLLPHVP